MKRGRERNTQRERVQQYIERETARAIRRVVERDNQSKVLVTTGRGGENSGESEENRERDVKGDMCHVCIQREKTKFAIVNSTECSCAALQQLLLLCWLEKICYLCILMIKNGLIYKWAFKILGSFQFWGLKPLLKQL